MKVFFHHDKPFGLLRIFGEDAEDYLQSQVTVNVRKLTAGCVNFALRLNSKGKVLAGFYLLREEEESFIVFSRTCSSADLEKLLGENIVADDVEFEFLEDSWDLITTKGEDIETLHDSIDLPLPSSGKFSSNQSYLTLQDDRLGEEIYSILSQSNTKETNPWKNGTAVEWAYFDKERILSGLVEIPKEIGPEDLPQEGNLDSIYVDFNKGCYLGQEVMARILAMGRVKKKIQVVKCPKIECPNLPRDLLLNDKVVGSLRSLTSFDNNLIGFALVHEKGMDQLNTQGLDIDGVQNQRITLL